MSNSMGGMFDVQSIQNNIRIGDGTMMQNVAIGSKHVLVIQKNGNAIEMNKHVLTYSNLSVNSVVP